MGRPISVKWSSHNMEDDMYVIYLYTGNRGSERQREEGCKNLSYNVNRSCSTRSGRLEGLAASLSVYLGLRSLSCSGCTFIISGKL